MAALAPPEQPHFMFPVLALSSTMENLAGEEIGIYEQQITTYQERWKQLQEDYKAKNKEYETANRSQSSWGAVVNVSQYLLTASSFILGATLISGGVAVGAGWLLVASGVAGVANLAFHDFGVWQTAASWFTQSLELQLAYARKMEMAMFTLSFGLGLAGGVWAYVQGALTVANALARQTMAEKVSQSIGLANGSLSIISRLFKARAEKQLYHAQADMTEIDSKFKQIEQLLGDQSMAAKERLQKLADILQAAEHMVQNSQTLMEL